MPEVKTLVRSMATLLGSDVGALWSQGLGGSSVCRT